MPIYFVDDQVSLFDPDSCAGKTSPVHSPAGSRKARISESFSKGKSKDIDGKLRVLTVVVGILFVVTTVALNVISLSK